MSENRKIYDVTFKRMFRLSGRMLIKFVNKVFEKNFPLDAEVKFLDPGSEDEENKILEKDIYFEICGERFQIVIQIKRKTSFCTTSKICAEIFGTLWIRC